MKIYLILYSIVIGLCINSQYIMAQTNDINTQEQIGSVISSYAWQKRQLIVFSPSSDNEQYRLFKDFKIELKTDFIDRKLQIWHLIDNQQVKLNQQFRNDLSAQSFRDYFQVDNDQFTLILIGLDTVVAKQKCTVAFMTSYRVSQHYSVINPCYADVV